MFSKCVLAAAATIWFAMLGADHRVMAHDAALDSEIFTTWKFGHDGTSLSYLVCGSTKKTEGCYAKGNLSPFENVCAILDGRATRLDRVLTRDMYVLDRRTSAEQPVLLNVYTRTDTFEQGV